MLEQQHNEMQDIMNSYLEQEKELEKRIRECENSHHDLRSTDNAKNENVASTIPNQRYQREASQARNRQLLKDLEKTKAILRTESTFTPTDLELYDLAAIYREFLTK